MKKIFTAVFISLLLFMSSSHAMSNNYSTQPVCHDDVTTLPIFELSTEYNDKILKHGTTFLVDQNMWATAYHVVSNISDMNLKYYIVLPNGSKIEATVIQVDAAADIAMLYAPSGKMTPIAKMSKPLKRYEPIWNIGLPAITIKNIISFEGIILAAEGMILISNAIAFSGMSGGPQVRCNKNKLEVVGVIVKTIMSRFQVSKRSLRDGTIIFDHYYQISGSKSSPHIAKNMVDAISNMIDNE